VVKLQTCAGFLGVSPSLELALMGGRPQHCQIFPLNAWHASSRDTLRRAALDWWSVDRAVDIDILS